MLLSTRKTLRRSLHHSAAVFAANGGATNSLSPETIRVVKSTAPVLAQHGYAITRSMYSHMFAKHPKVKELFNPSHQVEILPSSSCENPMMAKQPQSLACAVHAYAANIDNLEALTQAVERIAQKHVSLNVLPEHYPIVGESLLWALTDVLGEAASPQVLTAWTEAYGFLADIFIDRERTLRETKAAAVGGWQGWRPFRVVRKELESSDICSFYLTPADGGPLATFEPGQYTALRVETPEFTTQRNYTLSMPPGQSCYRITVKRENPLVTGAPPGQVSNWLHDHVAVGDALQLGIPSGDFVLDAKHEKPIVLISAGVGLTPVVSMMEYLMEHDVEKTNVVMIHAARNPQAEAMHDHLRRFRQKNLNLVIKTLYDEPNDENYARGPLTMEKLDMILTTRDCHYYFCGPTGFMKEIYSGLHKWNIPTEQIHFEFFGPHGELLLEEEDSA